jgi:hypothetical protein
MPQSALNQITVGGPCKVSVNGNNIYFEEGVKITPHPTWRAIPSGVGGEHDDTLVDLVFKISGRPKAVWGKAVANAGFNYRDVLLPAAYTNWSTAGALMCGLTNANTVAVLGSDANGFSFTRACLTKMPDLFLGLGQPLYGEIEFTAFLGTGKGLTDPTAFYQTNVTPWDQSDYPTANQEAECTGAWGALQDWQTIFAEEGFKLTHELKINPVKQGNITVDYRIASYRAMISFTPQQPSTADLLQALALQDTSVNGASGIGTRRSANAFDFAVNGAGISVTSKSMGLNKGEFLFDHKANRHGEFGMITALAVPGQRLFLA